MTGGPLEPIAVANRAPDVVAKDLSFNKFVLELGLDPVNISYHGIFNRLMDIALSNINLPNLLALFGAMLYLTTLIMRTIVPLRVFGIISTLFFATYALAGAAATFFLYPLSLPVNVIRLHQMLALIRSANFGTRRFVDGTATTIHDTRRCRANECSFAKEKLPTKCS